MGLNWSLSVRNKIAFEDKIDRDEMDVAHDQITSNPQLEGAWHLLFGCADEMSKAHQAKVVRKAIVLLIDNVAAGGSATIYRIGRQIDSEIPYTYSSRLSGIRIAGALYNIDAGVDLCRLIALEIQEGQALSKVNGCLDIRDLSFISTDNLGLLKITRRTRPGRLVKTLRGSLKALSEFGETEDVRIERD